MRFFKFLVIFLIFIISQKSYASQAIPTPQKVELNGEEVKVSGYLINNNNYFKIRDIAAVLNDTESFFNVSYNKEKEAVEIFPKVKYERDKNDLKPLSKGAKKAVISPQKFYLSGKPISIAAFSVEGNNYFKLRDLGTALNFIVKYDDKRNVVEIGAKKNISNTSEITETINLPAFPAEGIPIRKYLYTLSFNIKGEEKTTPNYDATQNILVLLTESGKNLQAGELKVIFYQDYKREIKIDNAGVITLEEMQGAGADFEKPYSITLFLSDGINDIPLFMLKHN